MIAGRVLDDSTGDGIERAVVTVSSTTMPGGDLPNGGGGGRAQLTDSRGRFLFTGLPASTFAVTIQIRGYSPVDTVFTNRGAGLRIQLLPRQVIGDLAVRMWREASISGIVTDDAGEPVVAQPVLALRRSIVSGYSQFVQSMSAITDDRGIYRIAALAPGDYAVGMLPQTTSGPASVYDEWRNASAVDQRRIVGEYGSGVVTNGGIPIGNQLLFPGYDSTAFAVLDTQGRVFVYPPTFHPVARVPHEASIIALQSGEERGGVDLRLTLTPTQQVSGIVTHNGMPVPGLVVRLSQSAPTSRGIAESPSAVASTDSRGAFTLLGVPRGSYVLTILRVPRPIAVTRTTAAPPIVNVGAVGAITSSAPAPTVSIAQPSPDPTLWARRPITVGDDDITGLDVPLRTGFRVTARVEFVGQAPQPDRQVAALLLYALRGIDATASNATSQIGPEFAFTTPELPPGRYVFNTVGKVKDWTFTSARTGGRDISDVPLDLQQDVKDLVVTFTDRPAELSGSVRTEKGTPDPAATVLIFPADPERWRDYGPIPRRLQRTPSSLSGSYLFSGLPAGEYLVAAVAPPPLNWQNPDMLRALAKLATRVTIGDAGPHTADIRSIKTPESGRPAPAIVDPPAGTDSSSELHGPMISDDPAVQATTPQRDGPALPASGTSSIDGRIAVAGTPPRPARHATLTIRSVELNLQRMAISDDEGRFRFIGLPPGRYTLFGGKPGFIDAVFGAPKTGMAGGVIALGDGQRVSNVSLTMLPGAVITGRVIEPLDMPRNTVRVFASRIVNLGGQLQLTRIGGASVDDRGAYRVFALPPGSYVVSAEPTPLRELEPLLAADLDAFAKGTSRPTTDTSRPPRATPVTMFYPSVFDPLSAAVVTVGAGEERSGIDISLQMAPMSSVDVTVVGADGRPAIGVTPVLASGRSWERASGAFGSRLIRTADPSRFLIEGLPPGEYALSARASTHWALSEFSTSGQDLAVTVQLQPGMTVRGRATFEGQAVAPATPTLRLVPLQTTGASAGVPPATLNPDGTFEFAGVAPNRYRLTATVPAADARRWSARAALLGGRDVIDVPFEIAPGGNIEGLDVRFTD